MNFRNMVQLRKKLKILKKKFKIIIIVFIIIIMYIIIKRKLSENNQEKLKIKLQFKVVHLDLKGAPPKLEYLKQILRTIKSLGANGLLIEYEDMFPYEGNIYNLSSPHRYELKELRKLLDYANQLKFVVIPLIQVFGHMEFALKLNEFKHLRENIYYPDCLCPSNNGSIQLIHDMLEQIILFHQTIAPLKYIHIGCDEVYQMNACELCKRRKLTKHKILFNHMAAVTKIVHSFSPQTTVLIWDDMMHSMKPKDWNDVQIPNNVQPVIWNYQKKFSNIPHTRYYFYQKHFQTMWGAAAFKGADGLNSLKPNVFERFSNIFEWLHLMSKYGYDTSVSKSQYYNFIGLILTGWSRYSHFSPICDLLPISIPSLVLDLMLIAKAEDGIYVNNYLRPDVYEVYQNYLMADFRKFLRCDTVVDENPLDSMVNYTDCKLNLSFPMYQYVEQLEINLLTNRWDLQQEVIDAYNKFNYFYNLDDLRNNFKWCVSASVALNNKQNNVRKAMSSYFKPNVIHEFVTYRSYNAYKHLDNCIKLLGTVNKVPILKRGRQFPVLP